VKGSMNLGYNMDITAGVGTRSYASPEQMKGGSDYDSSTDIYSLGIILFELCYPMYTVSTTEC
jgi:serine/threonine protein kinase